MNDLNITFENFNRRKYLKILKSRFDQSIFLGKLKLVKNDEEIVKNYKKIIFILNAFFRERHTFDNGLIYYIIKKLEEYSSFLNEFYDSVRDLKQPDAIKDRHIVFFEKQKELISFLENPIKKIQS